YAAARGDAITDAQGSPVVRPGEPVSRIGGLRAEALVEPGCDEMGSGSSPGAAPTGRKAHEAARFVLFAHGRTRWSDQPNDRSRSSGQPFIEKWPKPDAQRLLRSAVIMLLCARTLRCTCICRPRMKSREGRDHGEHGLQRHAGH